MAQEAPPVERLLLRIPEAAEVLSLSRSTIYRLINNGELPVVRIGRSVRIAVSDLERWARTR